MTLALIHPAVNPAARAHSSGATSAARIKSPAGRLPSSESTRASVDGLGGGVLNFGLLDEGEVVSRTGLQGRLPSSPPSQDLRAGAEEFHGAWPVTL